MAARELMRRFRSAQPEGIISEWMEPDGRSDAEIAQALAAEGWLKINVEDLDGEAWWVTTTRGNALAQASFGKPITRATAARHLAAVIERAQAFNADSTHLGEIVELVVFGSYLDPAATHLGDLDLGVTFRSRIASTATADEHTATLLAYARASGRQFNTFLDRLFWPEHEAILHLRNRSAVINITTEDVGSLTDRWETVYRASSAPTLPSPSLIFVHTDADDPTEAAIAAAVANAALEGIRVEADEQELIRRHQRGELTQEEFLAAARALAAANTGQGNG